MKFPIYLDHHATTPVDPRVLEAMMPYLTTEYGNAASRNHAFGWRAAEAVNKARAQVALLINADPREIIFTSGATESNNLAIKGIAEAARQRGDHIITAATEHKAVLDVCRALERRGFRVTVLPVDRDGLVGVEEVRAAISERTILVTLMAANNEIGTLHPLAGIGRLCRERGIPFHTDAAQAVGKIPVDVQAMGIDLLSCSAHKLYGPKGIGALFVRNRIPRIDLQPLVDGGGHERGLRSGTLNVPGCVGFGKACEVEAAEMSEEAARLLRLRERLKERILGELDGVELNGHPVLRLPGNLNLSFSHVEAESFMMAMSEVAVSSGAACSSATMEPSHVLLALGKGEEAAHTSIRFGLGRGTTEQEVEYVARRVTEIIPRLREISPAHERDRRVALGARDD